MARRNKEQSVEPKVSETKVETIPVAEVKVEEPVKAEPVTLPETAPAVETSSGFRFRYIGDGDHSEGGRVYKKGDVINSHRDLAEAFGKDLFRREE